MGMYDRLICEARLPCKNDSEARQLAYQTKDVEYWKLTNYEVPTIRITEKKYLVNSDGMLIDYSGMLNFYSNGFEFQAKCLNGTLTNFKAIQLPKKYQQ